MRPPSPTGSTRLALVSKLIVTVRAMTIAFVVATPGQASPARVGSSLVEAVQEAAFGDLPEIRARGTLRVLVPYSVTAFYLDRAQPKGLEVDAMTELEQRLRPRRGGSGSPLHVVYVPTPFDRLLTDLAAGKGDVAAGLLTVTDERSRIVDFSQPYVKDVSQVLVSARTAPAVRTARDLSGRRVHVPGGSSTVESLRALSRELAAQGLAPVEVVEVPGESWEGLLQMVGAGMFDHTVADDFLAKLWASAVPSLRMDDGVRLRDHGALAWGVRKDSPELRAALDDLARHRRDRSSAEVAESIRRYTRDPKRLHNALSPVARKQGKLLEEIFREAGDRHGFDWLLLVALGFQESRLDPKARNPSGAVGLLQVLPSTGVWLGFPDVHPVRENVLAGTTYLALLRRDHFADAELEPEVRLHFALAAYNAGPARIAALRRRARDRGLDPNVWFGNVELEAYRDIGEETPRYVANVNRYYVAYRLGAGPEAAGVAPRSP